MHKLFRKDRMCKCLIIVFHHSITSRYLMQKVIVSRNLWRWKQHLDIFYTNTPIAMKMDAVQLNIACLIPHNLESKFTFLHMKVYKWGKRKPNLSITLMPEQKLKMIKLKVRPFIFQISIRDDKYYVAI